MNISGGNATAKEKREGFNQRARGDDEIQKSRMNQAKEKKANGVRRGKTGCVTEVALEGKPGGKQTGPLRNNKKAEEDFKFSCSVEYTWSVLAFIYGCLLNDRSDWFLWLHRPRAPGVVMTTSVLLGWWIWLLDFYGVNRTGIKYYLHD